MGYTFEPKEPHARAYGNNLDISTKNAQKICRVIRGKRLSTAKKILDGLITQKKSIDGKYYTKAANAILSLLEVWTLTLSMFIFQHLVVLSDTEDEEKLILEGE